MTNISIQKELQKELNNLPLEKQAQVLEYLKELNINGKDEKSLIKFAGKISSEDLEIMKEVIEKECERVDKSEW